QPALREMSMFSGTRISLAPAGERIPRIQSDEENGLIVFFRPLPGWNGTPVAPLIVRNEMPAIEQLNRSGERSLLLVFCFALVLLLLIYASLVRWVGRPLHQIMESLQ